MSINQKSTYLIVGAGVFGVSTAYHLIKKYPGASVTIVDRDAYDAESRVAASWDWNKVVRADYDDLDYCALALEAQDIFNTDPLWQPFFVETGIYWICRTDYAQLVIDNYKKLGRKADLKAVPVEEAKKMYGGLFADANYDGVKEVLVNKTSGYAHAGDALRAITKECIRLGVTYVVGEVATATFSASGSGACTGVTTTDGRALAASHTILCTGAFTAKLLARSAHSSGIPAVDAGGRIVAGGIATGMVTLHDDAEYERYRAMPVGVQGYRVETGPFIGSLPPTKDRELKWWGQKIFANTQEVVPGVKVSAPPDEPDYAQWKVSKALLQDIVNANHVFYGDKSAGWKREKHRICWDAFTTSCDFIISPHSGAKGLYVATCGSFHGYKFFPVLGKYIVQMLEGELAPHLMNKWGWDRQRPDSTGFADFPRFEMNDLLDHQAKI